MKDYLSYENERNKKHAATYVRLVKHAFGADVAVLVGHHIVFEMNGDLATENEIPSADTIMFDHDVMRAVFGERFLYLVVELAELSCDERDARLVEALDALDVEGAHA